MVRTPSPATARSARSMWVVLVSRLRRSMVCSVIMVQGRVASFSKYVSKVARRTVRTMPIATRSVVTLIRTDPSMDLFLLVVTSLGTGLSFLLSSWTQSAPICVRFFLLGDEVFLLEDEGLLLEDKVLLLHVRRS